MDKLQAEELLATVLNPELPNAQRLHAARELGNLPAEALKSIVALSGESSLTPELSREIGRSIASLSFRHRPLDIAEIYYSLARESSDEAYLGFDTEIAILGWPAQSGA